MLHSENWVVPGTNLVCPWDKPRVGGRPTRLCIKSLCGFFCSQKKEPVFLESGVFVPCCEQVGLTKQGEKDDFMFDPQKRGALLLTPQKPTKMTKMVGVTHAKPPFANAFIFDHPDCW